jgi:hypothetical protein
MRVASLLIGLSALFCGNAVEACSVHPGAPPAKLVPNQVVFAGVVEGYALPKELLQDRPAASGLRVRVTEVVVAAQVGAVVDVYPLSHGPDCRALPKDLVALQASYRPGMTVAVVGWSEPGTVGLPTLVRTSDLGQQGISIVPADTPRTANGTLDFAQVVKAERTQAHENSTDSWQRLYEARSFQYYEFHKSLALLASGLDEPHKVMELENVRYYHRYACMMGPEERKAYVELVHDARLSEPAQARVLAGLPNEVDASGRLQSLKGTVFDGYCDMQ